MSNINIAYSATQDWFDYTRVSIYSMLQNAKLEDNYHFFILSNSFTENDKNNFLLLNKIKKSEYTFITMDNNEFNNFFKNPLGNSTNYRLKLASITNVDKILYLDSDTFVLSDISEFYNTNIDDFYISAIKDKSWKSMRFRITNDESFVFVNTGVILMNLKKFRENNLESKLFKYLEDNKEFGHCDQDAINAICLNNIKYMPLKYNIMVGGFWAVSYEPDEFEIAKKYPVIVHFVNKPWKEDYLAIPFKDEWRECKNKLDKLAE